MALGITELLKLKLNTIRAGHVKVDARCPHCEGIDTGLPAWDADVLTRAEWTEFVDAYTRGFLYRCKRRHCSKLFVSPPIQA